MEPVRLPVRKRVVRGEREDVSREGLDQFVGKFVNQAFKEMKGALSRYHSISEMSCRRELGSFFRQKAADFECLSLFLTGVEYLGDVDGHGRRIREIRRHGEEYVRMADTLAHRFEGLKRGIAPKCDVLTSLQTVYNPDHLLPSLKEEARGEMTDFSSIDRLNRIYLRGEDLSVYETVCIERGISMLGMGRFLFSLALCGEISRPEWKLINVKSGCELFDKHLMFSMPHRISGISRFLRMYRVHSRAREIFQRLRECSRQMDMEVRGYYKRFEATTGVFRVTVSIGQTGINGKLFLGEDVFPGGDGLMEEFEEKISEFLRREREDAGFSFLEGFRAEINGDSRTFRNVVDMDRFLDKERENQMFYGFFEKRFRCYRDHKNTDFGERNVFVVGNGHFVCVKLCGLIKTQMGVRVFVGSHGVIDFLVYSEVSLEAGEGVCGVVDDREKQYTMAGTEDLYLYFERNMGLLLAVHRLIALVNGEVRIRDGIFLLHRTGGSEVRFKIEERDGVFSVSTGKSRMESPDLDVVCGHIGFVLATLEILEYSRVTDVFTVAATCLYQRISLVFCGLELSLMSGSRTSVETDSAVLQHVFDGFSGSWMDVFNIMCCFHNIFSAGLVPDVSTPSCLIFLFRHTFQGKIRLRFVDRTRFEVVLDGCVRDVARIDAEVVASTDMDFVERLSEICCRERRAWSPTPGGE